MYVRGGGRWFGVCPRTRNGEGSWRRHIVDLHVLNIWTHIAAGAAALGIGSIPLLTSKGGILHRRFGIAFVAIGAVLLVTALIGNVFFNPPAPLIAASLAAGYQFCSSLRALSLRGRGPTLIDASLALIGLGGCVALFVFMGPGTASWTPAIGYSTVGYVTVLAVYDLSRHLWWRTWIRLARPLDHGLKMTGAYFAMMSAGVGNVLRDLQPWSQVGPSMLGVIIMIVLAFVYITRGAFGGQSPSAPARGV